MDLDFKYNGSRYFDPTAYIALNKVKKGEKKMDKNKTGELWEATLNNKETITALVLKDDGDTAVVIRLTKEENSRNDIKVICGSIMYGRSIRLQYVFSQYFDRFIRKLSDTEYDKVINQVSKTLGLRSIPLEPIKLPELKEAPKVVQGADLEELAMVKGQLEVYKKLYDDLMQKLIGKVG